MDRENARGGLITVFVVGVGVGVEVAAEEAGMLMGAGTEVAAGIIAEASFVAFADDPVKEGTAISPKRMLGVMFVSAVLFLFFVSFSASSSSPSSTPPSSSSPSSSSPSSSPSCISFLTTFGDNCSDDCIDALNAVADVAMSPDASEKSFFTWLRKLLPRPWGDLV